MSGKIQDLKGKRFDKLLVVAFVEIGKTGNARWDCVCDCGRHTIVYGSSLKKNIPHSCPHCKNVSFWEKKETHRESKTRLYNIYYNMRKRCENENAVNYENYGGRGITVCDLWRNSYEAFSDWAHRNGYTDKLTLDRIDSNGNYSPDNCRWVTYKEQGLNTRANNRITFNGETLTVTEWADKLGIKRATLCTRLKTYGWPVERALTEPTLR